MTLIKSTPCWQALVCSQNLKSAVFAFPCCLVALWRGLSYACQISIKLWLLLWKSSNNDILGRMAEAMETFHPSPDKTKLLGSRTIGLIASILVGCITQQGQIHIFHGKLIYYLTPPTLYLYPHPKNTPHRMFSTTLQFIRLTSLSIKRYNTSNGASMLTYSYLQYKQERKKNLFTQTTTSPLRLEYESTHTGKTCEWSCHSLIKKHRHVKRAWAILNASV